MAPLTNKGKSWEFANSFWMIWSWVPLFGFISFLYIGLRVKQRKWLLWGALYFIPWILAFALPDATNPDGGWTDDFWVATVLLAWLGSAYHAFRVRKEYLLRRAAFEELQWKEAQELKNRIELEYNVDLDKPLAQVAKEQAKTPPKTVEAPNKPANAPRQHVLSNDGESINNSAAKEVAEPTIASAAEVVEPQESDLISTSKPVPALPSEPINLNKATEAELALLPSVGEILAKRAVSEREVRGGFRSVEEFVGAIGLRPELVERIRPYAFVA